MTEQRPVTVTVSAQQLTLLAALLDHTDPPWREGELPPLAHWLLFPPTTRQSELGPDGHPKRDDARFPRRMWAGSRVRFLKRVPLGGEVSTETVVADVAEKTGRSGPMRFETVLRKLYLGGDVAIEEEQDIVYREAAAPDASAAPSAPAVPAPMPPVTRVVKADPVALFRYSALTFNGHRIHYDREYAVQQEGYPALVVHGPLIATLLMDHYLRHRPASEIATFSFRAMRPIFDTDRFTLGLTETGEGADLVAIDVCGELAMQAQVGLKQDGSG